MQRKPLSLNEALAATRQTTRLVFHAYPQDEREWQDLIRDVIAIANSFGGIVLLGVDRKGTPTEGTTNKAPGISHVQLSTRIANATGTTFEDFRIQEVTKQNKQITAIIIGHAPTPMVETATGTIFLRKSQRTKPANTKDLHRATEKLLRDMRKELIAVIREVTAAAATGATVEIHHIEKPTAQQTGTVRVTHDPNAPQIRVSNPDAFWPYRQKEVVELVNQALPANKPIRPYEIMCVRKVHNTDSIEEFTLKQSHASNKYSDQFVKWLIEQYRKDQSFFECACQIMRTHLSHESE